MKKKKLQLEELKVKSFVTTMDHKELSEVQGGFVFRTRGSNWVNIGGTKGKLPIMTVTEPRKDDFYVGGITMGGGKKGK